MAQGLWFTDAKNLGEILTGSSQTEVPIRGGVGSNGDFQPISRNSPTVASDSGFLLGLIVIGAL